MKKKIFSVYLVVSFLTISLASTGVLFFNLDLLVDNQDRLQVPKISADSPILLDGDLAVETFCTLGDGTEAQPYLIHDYEIDATSADGIHILNTEVYIEIRNCTIINGKANSKDGIHLYESHNVSIIDCQVTNNRRGIFIDRSDDVTVYNSNCTLNTNGIYIYWSYDNIINSNNCSFNGRGIYLETGRYYIVSMNTCSNNNEEGIYSEYTDDTKISYNVCHENKYGIRGRGRYRTNISHNDCALNIRGIFIESPTWDFTTYSNTCTNNSGCEIYLYEGDRISIENNVLFTENDGIKIIDSYRVNITNNQINGIGTGFDEGIGIEGQICINVLSNEITNGVYGISLNDCDQSIISENILSEISGHDIYAFSYPYSDNITYSRNIGQSSILIKGSDNIFTENYCGIRAYGNNNNFTHNHGWLDIMWGDNCFVYNNTCNNRKYDGVFADGLHAIYSNYCKFIGNRASMNEGAGLFLEYCDGITIMNNEFLSNEKSGIHLRDSCIINITDNICNENQYGINLNECKVNLISKNEALANKIDGIILQELDNTSIIQNDCSENGENGIHLIYSSYNLIDENNCTYNTGNGIFLDDSDRNNITNNDCSSNGGNGIYLIENSHGNNIIGNDCRFNAGEAILQDSTSTGNNLADNKTRTISSYPLLCLLGIIGIGVLACSRRLYKKIN